MPTITLNKTVFEKLVGKKLPLEQLKDRISMLGTDLEKIEGEEIHVEVFPNRPDMLSEQGFARAFSSFIGVKTGLREYKIKKSGYKVIVDPSVTMRPYTACALIKNITFTDERIRELMQVQEKLATTHGRNRKKSAYGIYPLQNIQFPIHYVAKDAAKIKFKPLGFHQEMLASEVPAAHPKGKAYQHLTEGWKKYPFFIDAANQVLCMLPFTNSQDTGKVDENTRDVFVECTGVDLQNVQVALNILATTLADMGGEIYSLDIVYADKTICTPDLNPKKMKLNLEYLNKRLGLELKEKEAVLLLERMGYGYEKGNVLIPAYRADILHQVDLMEDVAIAYGYENFEEQIPNVATIGEEDPLEKFIRKVREILIGIQLLEVKNYHLLTEEELKQKMNSILKPISLKNATGDYNHLRNSLLPSVLKNLAENQHHEYPQNLFEIGRTFTADLTTETGILEREKVAIFICHETADYTEIRQKVDLLLRILGLDYNVKELRQPSFVPGRVGEILIRNEKAGILGEIHPEILTRWNISTPVVAAELDLQKLFELIIK